MLDVLLMIAQQTTTPASPSNQPQGNPWGLFLPLGLAIAVFYFFMWRGQKKDRQRFENMLNSLARNDRVQTVGGIFGTVVETRGDEVVLKVDETNNVKIRVHRSAIKEVSSKQAQAELAATSS